MGLRTYRLEVGWNVSGDGLPWRTLPITIGQAPTVPLRLLRTRLMPNKITSLLYLPAIGLYPAKGSLLLGDRIQVHKLLKCWLPHPNQPPSNVNSMQKKPKVGIVLPWRIPQLGQHHLYPRMKR
ncbi:unnamed protein product [Prunus armeniaca]